jgi:hypothetical protein
VRAVEAGGVDAGNGAGRHSWRNCIMVVHEDVVFVLLLELQGLGLLFQIQVSGSGGGSGGGIYTPRHARMHN